jgi:hypothetical protein
METISIVEQIIHQTCVQIDNEQWGPYTDWKTITLTGSGSIDDSSIVFTWDGELQSSTSNEYTSIGSLSGNCPLLRKFNSCKLTFV